jgi:hypothetical protein
MSEAKGQIVVSAGLEQSDRTFQMIPRLAILASEPASDSGGAMGDAGLGRIGARLGVVEEGHSVRPHRRRAAAALIEVGRRLIECKRLCKAEGRWLQWIREEFGWSVTAADNFINVTTASARVKNFESLLVPITGLYLPAAPNTPPEVIGAFAARSEQGERLSLDEVKRVIAEAEAARRTIAYEARDVTRAEREITFERTVEDAPVREVRLPVTYSGREEVKVPFYREPHARPAPDESSFLSGARRGFSDGARSVDGLAEPDRHHRRSSRTPGRCRNRRGADRR